MSESLTEFLLARIAEDEGVARAAIPFGTGDWETYTTGAWVTGVRQSVTGNIICHARSRPNGSNDHIARHDPARVLAECEAKRRMVEILGPACDEQGRQIPGSGVPDALAALALPYADHDDYRPEWRP